MQKVKTKRDKWTDRRTDAMKDKAIPYDTNKAESSKVIQVDKGVGVRQTSLWTNSTTTGESEILYFPLPSKPFEYTYWIFEDLSTTYITFKFKDCRQL